MTWNLCNLHRSLLLRGEVKEAFLQVALLLDFFLVSEHAGMLGSNSARVRFCIMTYWLQMLSSLNVAPSLLHLELVLSRVKDLKEGGCTHQKKRPLSS